MDPSNASAYVDYQGTGIYSLIGFYSEFIHADAACSGDAAQEAYIAPLLSWYRAACTDNHAGESAIAINPVTSALPLQNLLLQGRAARSKKLMKVALGTGRPAVTSVAFAAGVNQLENATRDTSAAAITYQCDASKKTFTKQYGSSIAQTMYNLCNVADDDHLPDVHRLLAQTPKGRAYPILSSYAEERAYALEVPLTAGCLPLVTTKMTDQVFRSFKPSCTGVTFREGLPPFACVCEGHAESQTIQLMIKKAEVAKSSATLSLTNAE
jgi:hypothetical protein